MAYTNIKTEIDGKIYTNILREITGDILNEVLKKMVDSLGKGYRYMGILEPDSSRPSGDENMFMIATEAGYYTALANDVPSGITICSFSENSIQVETILNLDEIFSGNHNWGGNNTFSAELKVAFESLVDLNSDDNLQDMLNALMPRVLTAVENHIATFDAYGRAKDSGVSVDDLAKKDGISERLVSGSSRGILSPSAIEELFLFQRTANGVGGTGSAVFQSIKGNSIVWNQLVQNGDFSDGLTGWSGGPSLALESDGSASAVIDSSGDASIQRAITRVVGHKYFIMYQAKASSNLNAYGNGLPGSSIALTTSFQYFANIYTAASASGYANLYAYNNTAAVGEKIFLAAAFQCDLTQMFGSGYEPTSVADFTKFYNLPYFAYNPGAIVNNCATGMVTDGLNQWDEEWEVGSISPTTGENTVSSGNYRSKNYISCFDNTQYYYRNGGNVGARMFYYDSGKAFISYADIDAGNTFTTPTGCRYIRFRSASGSSYNNDICINLSWSGYRNGEYEPHWSDTIALPITTATGKLNGEGESVVITPNGLAGVGSSFDEAIVEKGMWTKTAVRRARVDMGSLEWAAGSVAGLFLAQISGQKVVSTGIEPNNICSKYVVGTTIASSADAADKTIYQGNSNNYIFFKDTAFSGYTPEQVATALDGEILDYELATPKEYILDTPVPVVARVDEDGTQTILPQGVDEQGAPMTAPFKASTQYPVKLGVAPIGQQSLVNLLERMKSAGKIASYTMVWDTATGVYDFTIS